MGALLLATVFCAALLPANAAAAVPAHGRAWELVTPGEVVPARVGIGAPVAPSGTSMVYMSFGPMPGAQSGALVSSARAVRGGGGWMSTPIGFPFSPPTDATDINEIILPLVPAGPESDPYSLVLSVIPLSSEPFPAGSQVLYRRAGDGFAQVAVVGDASVSLFFFRSAGGFVEPSTDGHRVVFASPEHLRPSDANRTEGASIYEAVGATLGQVDVGGDGVSLSPCGAIASHHNGISSDGSRIFFTSPPDSSSCAGPSEVYLREGGATTTKISASQCTRPDCGPAGDAAFAGATPDGRFAFLSTAQQLTNDDEDSLRDLYRYDVDGAELTLLSGGQAVATGELHGPLVFPSDDGAYVYFYGLGKLAPDESAPDGENLYVVGPDGLRFVAPARPEFKIPPAEETVQLARGGEVALFDAGPIAGVDGDADSQIDVYRYDAEEESLARLSEGPIGGNGGFDATMAARVEQEPVPGKPFSYRSLSADGRSAFFITAEALVPEDLNGSTDVYEWRQGRVGLVSSGTGNNDNAVAFLGSTLDASTAFFLTGETLLPEDRDGGEDDIYAARVGGGFADGAPPASGCEALECLPGASARLNRPIPLSARPGKEGRGIRLLRVLRRGREGGKVGGRFELLLEVPGPGRVSVTGIEPGGGKERVVTGTKGVSKAGRVLIPLRLSGSLARVQGKRNAVRVRLVIRQSGKRLVRTVTLAGRRR